MSGYVLKKATSELDWVLSWANGYLQPGEYVEADLGWRILPVEAEDDLMVAAQRFDSTASYAAFSGGVPGKVYMVSAQVRTDQGRELEPSIVTRIAA